MKPLEIRGWRRSDRAAVVPMIRRYLTEFRAQGGHIVPSELNVGLMWEEGMRAAELGEPTLVAVEPEDKRRVVGYVHAADVNRQTAYQLDAKMVNVFGVYTLPSQRGQMVYVQLLREVARWMTTHGYERGTSQNLLQNHHLLRVVFCGDTWPIGVQLEWQVTPLELDTGLKSKGVDR